MKCEDLGKEIFLMLRTLSVVVNAVDKKHVADIVIFYEMYL